MIETPQDRCPYPDGTKLCYWIWRDGKATLAAGVNGTVETITAESVQPSHMGAKAAVGERVIRLSNPDGTPSSEYDRFTVAPVLDGEPLRWFPLDTDPNVKQPAA